jgi:hypothetical protein
MKKKPDQTARLSVSVDGGDVTRRTIVALNIAAALKNADYPVSIQENGIDIKGVPIPAQCSPQGTAIILDIIA